jgi:hypothetical protein
MGVDNGVRLHVLLDGLSFPEGPRWHDGKLWFSDFYTFRVQTVDRNGRVALIATVPQRSSGLGFFRRRVARRLDARSARSAVPGRHFEWTGDGGQA